MRLLILLCLILFAHPAQAQTLTVFAAASLTDGMKDIAALWIKDGHEPPAFSFGASSTLARQIEQGAPANIFASADQAWMDALVRKGMIVEQTRRNILGNDLVLIVPADHPTTVSIQPGFDLIGLLGASGRLAVGDPTHVPVGLYAKQALTSLGVWTTIASRIAAAGDVRSGMLLVERGEAPVGIVYGTDAAISQKVRVAGIFPADSHDPITYPFAIVNGGDTAEARAFLRFLSGDQARKIWIIRGFKIAD